MANLLLPNVDDASTNLLEARGATWPFGEGGRTESPLTRLTALIGAERDRDGTWS